MVQNSSTQQLLPNADITLELQPPAGEAKVFHLSRSEAGNRMFQSANVSLPVAGDWSLMMTVQSGPNHALIRTTFPVTENLSRRRIVIAMMILPIVVILFAFIHRHQRRKQAVRQV